jgi:hypothetical protein
MKIATAVSCERQTDGSVKETPMAKEDVDLLIYDKGDGVPVVRVRPKQQIEDEPA